MKNEHIARLLVETVFDLDGGDASFAVQLLLEKLLISDDTTSYTEDELYNVIMIELEEK